MFKPATPPSENESLVYIIRKHFPPYNREARLFIDGNEVASIVDNDFVAVNVPVGLNYIQVDVTDERTFWVHLPIKEGVKNYFVITGELKEIYQGNAPQKSRRFRREVRALPVSQSVAESMVGEFGKRLE